MYSEVLDFAQSVLKSGKRVALVTLTEGGSHTPGRKGCFMAVDSGGRTSGTVGGGAMEHDLIERCKAALITGESFSFQYDLSEKGGTGMVCGGSCAGFTHILGQSSRLIVFGGGHVGKSLSEIAVAAGFDVTIVDERDRSGLFDGLRYIQKLPKEAVEELDISGDCYIVIATHGHVQDYAALSAVLGSEAAYIGMIGSANKVLKTFDKLQAAGGDPEKIAKVYSPIGLDIADGSPGEIAVAVLAEILAVKNSKTPRHSKDRLNA